MKIKIINTTTDSYKIAKTIAKILISEKLTPCVNIIPGIQSIYHWNGKLEESVELLLNIKTVSKNVDDCKQLILKHHNYKTPEIITFDGEILFHDYHVWFKENIK